MTSAHYTQLWLSLGAAAALIDVSPQDILSRSVAWEAKRVPYRVRFRLLNADREASGQYRYFAPDVEALLSDPTSLQESALTSTAPELSTEHKQPRHRLVEAGIYQNTRSLLFSERPIIGGKRTWRSLGTKSLNAARRELQRRKATLKRGGNPYASASAVQKLSTAGEVIEAYQQANYPDRYLNERTARTRSEQERHCTLLLKFWKSIQVDSISVACCDNYREWRLKHIKRGAGLRTIDRELSTVFFAFRYAVRREMIRRNPFIDRPKYQPSKSVVHCRQFMPGNSEELHQATRELFSLRTSEVLGFQLLFTAYTGQRTCEILRLKTNAAPDEPGSVTEDGTCLRVWRAKGQEIVNPFCSVHVGLQELLRVHQQWKRLRYPESAWFFPGRTGNKPVDKAALAHALRRLREKGLLKRKLTPHGARAFYVTVRRSQGTPDSQIALEIGHTSGGSTLSAIYGGVPPDWIKGGGPKMSWLPPGAPAWSDLLLRLQRVPTPSEVDT